MAHPYIRLFANKTSAPTVNDDETSTPPHEVGDWWIRVTGETYQCKDATDGAAVWESPSGEGTPGGSDTEIQYNDGGDFEGSPSFTWDEETRTLSIKGASGAGDGTAVIKGSVEGGSIGLSIIGGNAAGGNLAGGHIVLTGGEGNGSGIGGSFEQTAGNGGATGGGGTVSLVAGNGGATSGNGGAATVAAGNAQAGNGNGGNLILRPGNKHGSGTIGKVRIADPASSRNAIIDTSLLAASDKTFTLPNQTGTLALDGHTHTGLVTNGDSHDHNGGDGSQIDHVNLSNKGTNTHTQIDTHLAAASPHSGHANKSDAPSWTNMSYLNSWASYGAGYPPLRYWKDQFGWVHVEGFIKDGTINAAAGQLPVGHRPSSQFTAAAASNDASNPAVQFVSTDGYVVPYAGGNTWFAINMVFWPG